MQYSNFSELTENYLFSQARQVEAIQNAIKKADSENVKFFEHREVFDLLKHWEEKLRVNE